MNLTLSDFEPAHPSPSETLGYLIFGFYQVIAIVVLLNLLIAIMNSVWEEIKLSSDLIWKFNQVNANSPVTSFGNSITLNSRARRSDHEMG